MAEIKEKLFDEKKGSRYLFSERIFVDTCGCYTRDELVKRAVSLHEEHMTVGAMGWRRSLEHAAGIIWVDRLPHDSRQMKTYKQRAVTWFSLVDPAAPIAVRCRRKKPLIYAMRQKSCSRMWRG